MFHSVAIAIIVVIYSDNPTTLSDAPRYTRPLYLMFNGGSSPTTALNSISFVGAIKALRDIRYKNYQVPFQLTDIGCISWSSCLVATLQVLDMTESEIDRIVTNRNILQPILHQKHQYDRPHENRVWRYGRRVTEWMKHKWSKTVKWYKMNIRYCRPCKKPLEKMDLTIRSDYDDFMRNHVLTKYLKYIQYPTFTFASLRHITRINLHVFTADTQYYCTNKPFRSQMTLDKNHTVYNEQCHKSNQIRVYDSKETPLESVLDVLFNLISKQNKLTPIYTLQETLQQVQVEHKLLKIIALTPITPSNHHLFPDSDGETLSDQQYQQKTTIDPYNIEFQTFEKCNLHQRTLTTTTTSMHRKFINYYYGQDTKYTANNDDGDDVTTNLTDLFQNATLCKGSKFTSNNSNNNTSITHITLESMISHNRIEPHDAIELYLAVRYAHNKFIYHFSNTF